MVRRAVRAPGGLASKLPKHAQLLGSAYEKQDVQ